MEDWRAHQGTKRQHRSFSNDSTGQTTALNWVLEHAPGPRLVLSIEGTRSYGSGLARAAAAAGITVIEAEQPIRGTRRGKGKSNLIDAHLAALFALSLDAAKLPTPRADGDREALRIMLCTRQELTTTSTGQTNRLKAMLRDGGRHRPPPRPGQDDHHNPVHTGQTPPTKERHPRPDRPPRRDPPPGRGTA
jgi:hypothetical protein